MNAHFRDLTAYLATPPPPLSPLVLDNATLLAYALAYANKDNPHHGFGRQCVGELVYRDQFACDKDAETALQSLTPQHREAYGVRT